MKLNNKFALISVALMTGAACLTACSSDEVAENQGLSADGESVKTEFAINIPRAKSARMTAGNTQNGENPTFLGMEGIRLVPMKNAATGGETGTAFISTTSLSSIGASDFTGENKNTKVYKDIAIPLGTKYFLFYGHAQEGSNAETYFSKGILSNNVTEVSNSKDIRFNLNLVDAENKSFNEATTGNGEGANIISVLNELASAKVNQYTWSNLANKVDGNNAEQELGALYTNFIDLKAGSANSVLQTLGWLHISVGKISAASESNEGQLIAAIKTSIEKVVTIASENTATPVFTWKTDGTLANATFPRNINIPDGAAQLKFEQNTFSYVTPSSIGGDGTQNPNVSIANLAYPASLYYKANTEVKTGDATKEFPKTTTGNQGQDWSTTDWTGWGNEVVANTAKIALKDNINYAVGVLEFKIKCKSTQLPAAGTTNQPNTTVTVNNAGFPVTGLLIGGQPASVDYDFKPVIGTNKNQCFIRTIYDKVENVNAKAGAMSSANYTLVLPNFVTDAQKESVNFAVELTNNSGADFRGADGIIPNGGTFYLIGKLDPANATQTTASTAATNVFESDYKTIANVTVSTLAKAYNCIPDLRATNLQLGLSVDLTWETGLQFDVEIGQ